jgi:hypothetical protein
MISAETTQRLNQSASPVASLKAPPLPVVKWDGPEFCHQIGGLLFTEHVAMYRATGRETSGRYQENETER